MSQILCSSNRNCRKDVVNNYGVVILDGRKLRIETKLILRMLNENKWKGIVYPAMLVCLCVLLQNQSLLAQTNNTAEHDKLQTKVGQGRKIPKPEHPFSTLTIIVSNGKLLRDKLSCFVPSARFENTFYVEYILRADGTMCLRRNYPALVKVAPAEAVLAHIELGGILKDHTLIKLRADPGVDLSVALKTVQAIQGFEEKYETFQFLIDLSNPDEADERNRKERKGTEEEKGP